MGSARVNVYLLGSGIRGTLQLTRETEQALSSCSTVFVLHDDTDVLTEARRFCADVRDVADRYRPGTVRADTYHEIADALVERARADDTVGLLVHGHPLFLVSAAKYTLERTREAGLRVRVLPAVSSFDTLLCDLEIDFGYGLQLFDATTLLREGWVPNPRVPMLVFQLATTLTDTVVTGAIPPSVLAPLAYHLRQVYPPDHACLVLHSAAQVLESPRRVTVRLEDLDRDPGVPLWERPTLYVPAIGRRG